LYDDESLEHVPPILCLGEKEHILIVQDKTVFHTNKYCQHTWLTNNQQPIQKKRGGCAIHVSNFICKTIGQIKLSDEQICEQLDLPPELHLAAFEAQKITYPGKGFDAWWDLKQLIEQVRVVIKVFEYTHPGCVGVFMFDRSSTYGGFTEDTLNVNSINLNPRGKQKNLRDTIIPWNNPDPAHADEKDTCGKVQHMCFPEDHENPQLQGQPKGIKAVLEEQKSVWSKYSRIHKECGTKEVKKCAQCTKSQVRKDAEHRVAEAADMEQQGDTPPPGETSPTEEMTALEDKVPPTTVDEWCCMYWVLSLQEDF